MAGKTGTTPPKKRAPARKKPGPKPGTGGRPRWELNDERYKTVVNAMRIHCTQIEICAMLGVDLNTLNARLKERGDGTFSDLYEKHQAEGKASLRRMQWQSAEGRFRADGSVIIRPSVTAQIWLGKQELGQTDKVDTTNTHQGPGGGPMQTEEISPRDRITSRLARLATAGSPEKDTGGTE